MEHANQFGSAGALAVAIKQRGLRFGWDKQTPAVRKSKLVTATLQLFLTSTNTLFMSTYFGDVPTKMAPFDNLLQCEIETSGLQQVRVTSRQK